MNTCSFCGTKITPKQEETTIALFGKSVCSKNECEKKAQAEANKETDALMTARSKVLALLARRGFEEQSVPGFYLLDNGSTKIAVDLNHQIAFPGIPVIGVLQVNGDILEQGHGINKIDDLRREIEGIMKSRGAGNGKTSCPPCPTANIPDPQKKETPAPAEEKQEEKHQEAEAGRPEVIVPGNVLAILEKYGWKIGGNTATKTIDTHDILIDLSKLDQRGKAVEVAGYSYEFGQNNVIDAELKSLFGEIAKPATTERKPAKKQEVPDAHETALARIRNVELTPESIIKYLCPDATFEEAVLFLQVCKYRNLNPFIPGEVFLVKYDKTQPAVTVVGKYAFTKKADAHPDFRGYQAGIIVLNTEGKIEEREGTFYLPKGRDAKKDDVFEMLLGGWARVKRHGREDFIEKVALQECIRYKKDGQPMRSWAEQPAAMIRKNALVRALREAFPAELGGLYDQSEIVEVNS